MKGFEPKVRGWYIAGPMRGHDGFNFALFGLGEAAVLAKYGGAVKIANPARMDIERSGLEDMLLSEGWTACGRYLQDNPEADFDVRVALREDTEWICNHGTDILLLPGWEQSPGANAERNLAVAIGMNVWYLDPDSGEIVAEDPAGWSQGPVLADYWAHERQDVLDRFAAELSKATGDGSKKRRSGEKPPWYRDASHEGAIFSHITKWKRGEQTDPDSGAHPLVHAAWRCLAIACSENGNNPDAAAAEQYDATTERLSALKNEMLNVSFRPWDRLDDEEEDL